MRISELSARLDVQSTKLDDIAARIQPGNTDPEVPAPLEASVLRLETSVEAVNQKVPFVTPPV